MKANTRAKTLVATTPASSSSSASSTVKEKQEPKERIVQHQSSELLKLLKQIGKGYKLLCTFKCRDALVAFSSLPACHLEGAWVTSLIARAHYELVEYEESKKYFEATRKKEPFRTENMEIFSTLLWHMRKEKELSHLALELTEYDKFAPESWCVVGNTFSLQSDHSTANKFFQRVTLFVAVKYSCILGASTGSPLYLCTYSLWA